MMLVVIHFNGDLSVVFAVLCTPSAGVRFRFHGAEPSNFIVSVPPCLVWFEYV